MRDDQARGRGRLRLAAHRQALPQRLFGFDVERAGEIVEDQQLGVARKHAGGGRALHLAAGEPHAARPDQRVQPLFQGLHVVLQHGGVQHPRQQGRVVGQAKQDVLAQGFTEQARHLPGVSGSGRHKERGWVGHVLVVPEDFTGLRGEQAHQHTRKGALAGANAAGDHHKLAARQAQADVVDAAFGAGKRIAQVLDFESLQALGGGLGRVHRTRRQGGLGNVIRVVLNQHVGGLGRDDFFQALDGHCLLPVVTHERAQI